MSGQETLHLQGIRGINVVSDLVARGLTALFLPPIVMSVGFFLMSVRHPTDDGWFFTIPAISGAVVVPVIVLLVLWKKGRISSSNANRREERGILYCTSFVCAVISTVVLVKAGAPKELIAVATANVLTILSAWVLNRKLKVSVHCGAAAGVTAIVWHVTQSSSATLLCCALVLLIAWSRYCLKAHTMPETIVGTVLGGAYFSAAFSIF